MDSTTTTTARLLRTPDAAALLGISPRTLERLRLKGGGPPYRKAGPRIVVYDPADLRAWLSRPLRSTSDASTDERASA